MRQNHRAWIGLLPLALAAAWPAVAPAAPLLKAGDRMVFLGDSITEGRVYTRYVMNYFALRYPGLEVSFRNAGWYGDTAPNALKRLERDVLSLKPTVVSICLGMNDAGYRLPFNQPTYRQYLAGMSGLVAALKMAGVKPVLLTPGCVDLDRQPGYARDYNATLGRYAEGVKELAREQDVPVFDLHALMLEVQTRAKADDQAYTMIPDGCHPSPPGHAVIAYALLKALQCADLPSGLEIDAAAGRIKPDRCRVADLKVAADTVSFTRADEALPAWVDPNATNAFKYYPFQQELNRYLFKVAGLKAGNWALAVQGTLVGTFTGEQLAAGLDLALLPGPWQQLGAEVNRLAREQEDQYFYLWRRLSAVVAPKGKEAEQQAVLKQVRDKIAALEAARIKAAAGDRSWTWQLVRQPAPPLE